MDVQATARMLGISTSTVYALLKKYELFGLKVDGRWLLTKDSVLLRLNGSPEEEALRAIERGSKKAITAALKSGKVRIKNPR